MEIFIVSEKQFKVVYHKNVFRNVLMDVTAGAG